MNTTVSVIVAVYDNTSALHGLFHAIECQDLNTGLLELIVVDNHPQPVMTPGLDRSAPVQRRVVHEPRPGLSQARNTGIRHARGDILLITDPDIRPEPGWAGHMVQAMQSTGAYCAGGKVLPYFTGPRPQMPDEVLRMFVPPAWPAALTPLRAPWWVVGCNLALRAEPLPQFDTRFGVTPRRRLACEELELTVRLQKHGHLVVLAPDAVAHRAIHPADLTPRALYRRAVGHGLSVARLLALHPDADIYDSTHLREVIDWPRLRSRNGRRAAVAEAGRVTAQRAERLRLTRRGGARPCLMPSRCGSWCCSTPQASRGYRRGEPKRGHGMILNREPAVVQRDSQ